MTALALAGRLVTTAGILNGGVLEVRLDGTIGYVGPASGWTSLRPLVKTSSTRAGSTIRGR